jgi:pimeloyl-ACP methyl ester carboxylesterase
VLVFGQKIAYYDMGTGPTIVLVHGFGSQARFDWGNVLLPLSAHHRVLALDQIGWGHSDKPAIDYSIQTFVDFLGEFLRVMKVEHLRWRASRWADGLRRTIRFRRWRLRIPVCTRCPGRTS